MGESKISLKDFRDLTKDFPDDYMLYFSLDNVPYAAESFEVDISGKKLILK
ncbi:hypothetical protein [uncultured Methanobrevibacter sp.]|uniref:hypothetical protein n=1 Tax=uncultured Methanobrevibacter sp. TaxID=253161 RepID=UPI0025DAFA7B|nr:hypothetical protein [uncultured Methanobrevibacter sp.]